MWGPSSVATKNGYRYFITFTDDATHYTVTYPLKLKADALDTYKSFESWALTQQLCPAIHVLHSDHSGEYLSAAFDKHLQSTGTARRLTIHDSPALNGVAERLNRTLVERIRAFTHSSGMPRFLWGEALKHATWLKNRMATRALDNITPFQVLFGTPPDLSRLHGWGNTVWVHENTGNKLDARAKEGHWVGFDTESRGHHVYFKTSCSVHTERNVYFGTTPQLEGEQSKTTTLGQRPACANCLAPCVIYYLA